MKNTTVKLCIIGTIIVGLYVAEIYYKNYMFSQFKTPMAQLTVEQFQEIPQKSLASYSENTQNFIATQKKYSDDQQQKLRQAILVLSIWVLILFNLVLSQTKALNKALFRTA